MWTRGLSARSAAAGSGGGGPGGGHGEHDPDEALTPTFEDLAIDPGLDDVDRVVRYATGTVELQRLVHVMMLSDTARSAGFETAAARLFPLTREICRDQEPVVRQNLATQLSAMCQFCSEVGTEEAYKASISMLVPTFRTLVLDGVDDVREAASIHLIKSAAHVREGDLMEHILSIVLELAHDEGNEKLRITSAGLLNGLAPRFGPELCQQFVVPELVSLSQDPSFKVRKAVALSMDKIMRVAHTCSVRLLPAYERLSKDSIWGVRKACADSLALLAEGVDESDRVSRLLPLMRRFVRDNSKWVRGALSQRLGRFIACLPEDQITDELLDLFLGMADIHSPSCWINSNNGAGPGSNGGNNASGGASAKRASYASGGDSLRSSFGGPPEGVLVGGQNAPNDFANNIMYCCAFSFPAVVLKAGAGRWLKLQRTFFTLVNCDNQLVRRVMAYSLHELAKILGPAITETDLLPVLVAFLRDVDQVKTGTLLSMSQFYSCLANSAREARVQLLVDVFDEASARNRSASMTINELTIGAMGANAVGMPVANLTSATNRWRFRKIIASQMADFVALFSVSTTVKYIVPLGGRLLHDDVYEVREAAHSMVGPCLRRLREADENNNYQNFQDSLLTLARARSYADRQHYVLICSSLVLSSQYRDELTDYLGAAFLDCAMDPVANVRLACIRSLAKIAEQRVEEDTAADLAGELSHRPPSFFERFPAAIGALESLARDQDREVVTIARNALALMHL
ncbi:Serine/threonine-protein phosphatase 2A 65 kDa regulatory subunit A beta isoform [Hondaea fermentalgiana]|uniref:Serine/threonine-protein phosphatase 2A 65 kDa regulatory subunit A beta isoform n=1 Tax=Hondaea fermentalgiana TaxID=2315210 RepID=A0A2R5GM29_9STRA|nr:Serine/threonine-protein phosphatase 2A 65 kDa regulatory subunit A beta isoform [Hondaea fermentalgiana]|eukprot:GBG31937.1 Serine/threonine-protein phosphatase 2A 65 kDa regulatory subunit A beta isoform [Hondaea fermentalgiana]